jgi:uncharacterized protein YbaR (Trm112 family)
MEMDSLNCPHCGFKLKKTKRPFFIDGFFLGNFDALVCETCKRVYRTKEASEQIERYAQELGLWETEKEVTQNIEVLQKDAEEESGTNFPQVATAQMPLTNNAKEVIVEFKGLTKTSWPVVEYRTLSQTSTVSNTDEVRSSTCDSATLEK